MYDSSTLVIVMMKCGTLLHLKIEHHGSYLHVLFKCYYHKIAGYLYRFCTKAASEFMGFEHEVHNTFEFARQDSTVVHTKCCEESVFTA